MRNANAVDTPVGTSTKLVRDVMMWINNYTSQQLAVSSTCLLDRAVGATMA